MENGPFIDGLPIKQYKTWLFSIVMLVYRRVYIVSTSFFGVPSFGRTIWRIKWICAKRNWRLGLENGGLSQQECVL